MVNDETLLAYRIGCDVDSFVDSHLSLGDRTNLFPTEKLRAMHNCSSFETDLTWGIQPTIGPSYNFLPRILCLPNGLVIVPRLVVNGAPPLVTNTAQSGRQFVVLFNDVDMEPDAVDIEAANASKRAGLAPAWYSSLWNPQIDLAEVEHADFDHERFSNVHRYYDSLFFSAPSLTVEQLSWLLDRYRQLALKNQMMRSRLPTYSVHCDLLELIRRHSTLNDSISSKFNLVLEEACHEEYADASSTT